MTRVAIIGNAGGGKSPLARRPVKSGEVTTYRAADRVQWLPKPASVRAVCWTW
ncbi:hypothetical protein EDD55_101217 [Varunaivibrio sulfuroxidans]|uniref:Uncharacterized protein n=1 Tax=Varunaivibrio sulfuroxidans TaxID=1773489 RepID=A0A4R3JHZ5_9PROT|nr:hypothetical protein EDD55_101217 [Varunaivibrio sulfuroxidans]